MKADGGDPVAAWPRLGAKLGSAIERAHHAPLKAEVANEEPGEQSGDDLPEIDPDMAETPVEGDAQQPNDLRPTALGGAPIVLPARQELSPRAGRQSAAAQDDNAPGVDPDVEIKPSPASVTGDNASTGNAMSIDPTSEMPRAVSFTPLRASERTEPQQAQSTTPPHSPANSSREGQASGGKSLPEATEPVRAAPRVTVVSQQNVPAPMASTALVLVDSIAGSTLLGGPNTAPSSNAIHAAATHASAQSLKIQLHPAELGMVTATLRFAGERLSIELKVENPEAYRRLTSDSETIVGSLRDLGYDIDKVTILQSSIASICCGALRFSGRDAGSCGPFRGPVQFRDVQWRQRRLRREIGRKWRKTRTGGAERAAVAHRNPGERSVHLELAPAHAASQGDPPALTTCSIRRLPGHSIKTTRDFGPIARLPGATTWDFLRPLKKYP